MNATRQHATEPQARPEPRKRPSRPLMPAMPAGPDYWPVAEAAPPAQRSPRRSLTSPDGRVLVQAP